MNSVINVWDQQQQKYVGIPLPKGESGLKPKITVPYSSSVTVSANTETVIEELDGNISVSLGEGQENISNEWIFVIAQGSNVYSVNLPQINWISNAPAFTANSVTEVRLHYKGNYLMGSWC